MSTSSAAYRILVFYLFKFFDYIYTTLISLLSLISCTKNFDTSSPPRQSSRFHHRMNRNKQFSRAHVAFAQADPSMPRTGFQASQLRRLDAVRSSERDARIARGGGCENVGSRVMYWVGMCRDCWGGSAADIEGDADEDAEEDVLVTPPGATRGGGAKMYQPSGGEVQMVRLSSRAEHESSRTGFHALSRARVNFYAEAATIEDHVVVLAVTFVSLIQFEVAPLVLFNGVVEEVFAGISTWGTSSEPNLLAFRLGS